MGITYHHSGLPSFSNPLHLTHQKTYPGKPWKTRELVLSCPYFVVLTPETFCLPLGGQETKDREVDLVPQMLNETPAELLRRREKKTRSYHDLSLEIQLYPITLSEDGWGVQSPPKRKVFRFHYHSQKVSQDPSGNGRNPAPVDRSRYFIPPFTRF